MKRASRDTLTGPERSERMSRVRSKNTKLEMRVRRLVHGMGYRYRLHGKDLPGQPDLVFRPRRQVIFVHGCFWHRHDRCAKSRLPKSPERREYWRSKLNGNVRRDRRNEAALQRMGWDLLVIWECQTKDLDRVALTVRRFLGPAGGHAPTAHGPSRPSIKRSSVASGPRIKRSPRKSAEVENDGRRED